MNGGKWGGAPETPKNKQNKSWQKAKGRPQADKSKAPKPSNERYDLLKEMNNRNKESALKTRMGRLQWKPLPVDTSPLPTPECPLCGRPINDIASAIQDKNSECPAHFDCVLAEITKKETLEWGDAVAYIGGGRFAVVHYPSLTDTKTFHIKKIVEWENKDEKTPWRQNLADRFSTT
jgi:hypothetical protein